MNSFMHAFPAGAAGEICVSLGDEGDFYRFVYTDNGRGFPPGTDPKDPGSTGLMIVKRLAEDQLAGSLEVKSGNGVRFEIVFRK